MVVPLSLALIAFTGCEDDPPSAPPPPPPGAAAPGGQPAPVPGAQPASGADGQPVAAAAPQPVVPVAQKKASSRVPTASEMLGLGRNRAPDKPGGLPQFLAESHGERPKGESLLFQGRVEEPSSRYAKLKVAMSPVSPIERHWGADQDIYKLAQSSRPQVVAAPTGADQASSLFKGDAPPAADSPEKKIASSAAEFPLTMFRINETTGRLDTLEKSYGSKQGRQAAEQYAMKQGYKKKRPSQAALAKAQEQLKAGEAKKKKDAAAKKSATKEICKFQAYWTEGAVRQSRCFSSQKQLDAFMASRRKKAAPKPAARPSGGSAPSRSPSPVAPAPANDRSIKPVKFGK